MLGGTTALGWIALSRFPIAPSSNRTKLMWKGAPEMELAPKPVPQPSGGPGGSKPAARCPPNQTATVALFAVVANVIWTSTVLSPQFWKQELDGSWPTIDTLALETPPTRMLRTEGVSLLATASKESDGIGARRALEKRVEHALALTNPGRSPHSFNRSPDCVASTLVRKS